ncbi:unnamed protein product [Mytilus edulis]|uniref:IRG-type G domain-containing protein n=1 Tax=Mytilus edulis TaxID=6550 RepID=A0A8S3TP63_MYTED|nr:unnamed protein product [Mytilus edulis]
MGDYDIISCEEIDELQRLVEETGVLNLPNYISQKAKEWKEVQIHIAVLGETYVGKSTFINQLRGVEEWDNKFAPVGLGDTTLEPTAYENPYNKNMVFWDLPGVGTLKYSKDESYFRTINIERFQKRGYDFIDWATHAPDNSRKKKKALHNRVFKIAVISAGAAAVPFPGVDVAVDLAIITYEINFYMSEFGLDEESLMHLCKKTKTKYDQITESLKHSKSLLAEKSTLRTLFMKIVKTQAAEQVGGRFAKYIPVIGSIVSSCVAYAACVKFLRSEIDLLEEDAQTLVNIVIDKNKKL